MRLERTFEQRESFLVLLKVRPLSDDLCDDPRFDERPSKLALYHPPECAILA